MLQELIAKKKKTFYFVGTSAYLYAFHNYAATESFEWSRFTEDVSVIWKESRWSVVLKIKADNMDSFVHGAEELNSLKSLVMIDIQNPSEIAEVCKMRIQETSKKPNSSNL